MRARMRGHLASFWRALRWPGRWIRVTRELRRDIRWWHELWAGGFNGVTFWPDRAWRDAERGSWWTDACAPAAFGEGDLGQYPYGGAGALFRNEYWLAPWPATVVDSGVFINQLELLTTLAAIETWGPDLRHARVIMHGDNEVAVGVQNKGAAKEEALDTIAAAIEHAALRHGFEARASHVPSAAMLADPLSRGDEAEFLRRYAQSGLAPRFGPARRVEAPTAFLADWLRRLAGVKRTAAAAKEAIGAARAAGMQRPRGRRRFRSAVEPQR